MPSLQIAAAGLKPEYARETCEYILSCWIWPGPAHCSRRVDFMRTAEAVRTIEIAEAVPGRFSDRPGEVGRIGLDVLPQRSFEKELIERGRQALMVGEYYAIALRWDMAGMPVSVKDLRKFQTRPARRKLHPALDIGESALRDLLREYRPAVPLLTAAFIMAAEGGGPYVPVERIDEYLALSEWLARRLVSIRLDRRTKPLLAPGTDFWRVPPTLALSEVTWPEGLRPGVPPLPPGTDLFGFWKLLGRAD